MGVVGATSTVVVETATTTLVGLGAKSLVKEHSCSSSQSRDAAD
jgi:hypothetical protein